MIVVTGGAGFIGSNLVAALARAGRTDIVVCDRLGSADKWRNLAKHELADLIAPDRLPAFLAANAAAIDAVVHMGAISATTAVDADQVVETNFRLSWELWNWCAQSATRFIYASSAATYGDGSAGFDDEESPAALARLRPLNPYGWSKHLFDRRVLRAAAEERRRPPQWVGLKFFNVYGPNEYHKEGMRSLVARQFAAVQAGEPARLFASDRPQWADGGQQRDFIWVGDTVDVILWLLDHPEVSGLFNLGTGQARSWNDMAAALFAALGEAPRIQYVPMDARLQGHYQYHTEARMDRLRAAGYGRPFTSVEEGVRRYVQDHLTAADPYA
jgi:ADP-L-glycero-D-manno-heptose 6-epimerase